MDNAIAHNMCLVTHEKYTKLTIENKHYIQNFLPTFHCMKNWIAIVAYFIADPSELVYNRELALRF